MKDIKEYIESGILEMYVMGLTSEEENAEIEALALLHTEISEEIEEISKALEMLGKNDGTNSERLDGTVKPMLMAFIDYTERLKKGEAPEFPPALNENSKISDYASWINRGDMNYEPEFGNSYAKIIGYTPEMLTAIVWLKEGAPHEVHDKEYETFLVLEGSCDIVTADKVFSLSAGDYFQVPLHLGHTVKVTSEIPCKLVLQRMAA